MYGDFNKVAHCENNAKHRSLHMVGCAHGDYRLRNHSIQLLANPANRPSAPLGARRRSDFATNHQRRITCRLQGKSTRRTQSVQIVFRPQHKMPSHRHNEPQPTLGRPTFCRKSHGTHRHPRKLTKPVPCVLTSEAPSLDGGHSVRRAHSSRWRHLDGVSRAHSPPTCSPSHDQSVGHDGR